MEKYELHIGEVVDFINMTKRPRQTLIITKEQLEVIEIFAHQRKDEELNTIYKLNECEFRVYPHYEKLD
jgi:hypothetical protein